MKYTDSVLLSNLEAKNTEYMEVAKVLQDIDLLTSGGHKLEKAKEKFLPQRTGEDPEIYKNRLAKFTYTPLLGNCLNELVDRLSNSSIATAGLEGSNSKFWSDFKENTNLKGRKEKQLISYIFSEALKFKKVFIHIDKPKSEVEIINRKQEEELNLRPYIVIYNPLQVTDWFEEDDDIEWMKVRQITEDKSNPLAPPKKIATWTFIDDEYIAKYEAVVELDARGEISKISGDTPTNETTVLLKEGYPIKHNLGEIPVIKFELRDELWVADLAYHKSLEHLRLSCNKSDILSMVYIQRTYKRIQSPDPTLDPTNSFTNDSEVPTGLQHLLELDSFSFNEPTCSSIPAISDSLQQIQGEIRDLVALGHVSATTSLIAQSGLSKEMDFYRAESRLRKYGELLCATYQDLLQLVGRAQGISEGEIKGISVTGLNSFENDNLDKILNRLTIISKDIDLPAIKSQLPETVFKSMFARLCSQLMGSPSAEEEKQIRKEIDELLKPVTIVDNPVQTSSVS